MSRANTESGRIELLREMLNQQRNVFRELPFQPEPFVRYAQRIPLLLERG